jgi:predicted dehydrogenase
METKWRVGLVGVGRGSGYGKLFADEPRCEVTAVCDISQAALERFQRELNLPDSQCFADYGNFVGSGLDIVFVGTPMPFHAEQTIAAVEAGCHVLSEVTACSKLEDCGRIVEAVRRTGQTYMLAENCIYWHFVSQWKDMIAAGKLGEIFPRSSMTAPPARRSGASPGRRCTTAPIRWGRSWTSPGTGWCARAASGRATG